MSDFLEQPVEELTFTDQELFTKIWTSPKAVFSYIIEQRYDKYVTVLLILSGISRAFDRAATNNMGEKLPLWSVLFLCIFFGGLFGWISFYIYAALVNWTGNWLNAKGSTPAILRVLAYAMIPSILALLLLVPQVAIYGVEVFKKDGDLSSAGWLSNMIVYGAMFFEVVLGIWTVVLCVVGISEVQHLSTGKAILNLLLPVFVILVPILILVLLFKAF